MPRAPLTPAVLTRGQAAAYIGMSASWLKTAPMPRVDMRRPGGHRPVWRYLRADLDAWLAARRVPAGYATPPG